ncbi:MAG: RnfH family protein [Pseudomonadota bacterium]
MGDAVGPIRVSAVFALPGIAWTTVLDLPAGATVADAMVALLRADARPEGLADAIRTKRIGLFGRRVDEDFVLSDGDRLELYRPLTADPRDARRRRAARSG